jgi:hypothetical protein
MVRLVNTFQPREGAALESPARKCRVEVEASFKSRKDGVPQQSSRVVSPIGFFVFHLTK